MNTIIQLRQRDLALAIAVSVGLTACGGGGGGSKNSYNVPAIVAPTTPAAPPATTTPSTPAAPTYAFPVDVQITATNSAAAHAAGATGADVVIGIVDSGVNGANPALAGRVTANLTYVDPVANNVSVPDAVGHGTVVAELAAGAASGTFTGGIATGAKIVSARIIADKAPTDDGSGNGNVVTSANPLGSINSDVIAAGAKIINNSWDGLYWDAASTDTTNSFASAYGAAAGGALYVFAAGNKGKADPSDLAALPFRVSALEKGWLAVVALDGNKPDQLASYSNHCGKAMNYCLAAPGDVVALAANSTADKPAYVTASGTSFAAPQVSGAAAVVKGVFPTFSMSTVREILLGTADDLGDPGVDPVFGYGRLNVGKAIRGPGRLDWGQMAIDLGENDVTFYNDIAGAGGFLVNGNSAGNGAKTGKLVLASNNNTFTGTSTINADATLDALWDFPGSATVKQGGSLIARRNIGGTVSNSGRVQTTAAGARIDGDFTQTSTGTLVQTLGAPLVVHGIATLAGEFHVAGVTDGYVPTMHQQVLTASAVHGSFTSFTTEPNIFLATTLQYGASEVWVDTSQIKVINVATTTMADSAAAVSSAKRLDGAFEKLDQVLTSPSAAGAVAQGTLVAAGGIQQSRDTATARASLESLSGQLYAASTAVTLAGIEAGNDALMSHLDSQGAGGAWMQSLDGQGGLSRSGFGNVGFQLNGGLAGNDIRIGSNGFAGVAFAQMQSNGQLSGNFDRQRNRSTESMLYAGSRGANWYGVGRLGFGNFRGNTQRLLRFGDQAAFAGGDNTGHYNVAYGEVGYRTDAGAFSLTPFANVQYASIRRDAFEETGGQGFGLSANGQTTSRWQAGFGLRAGASWFTSMGKLHLDAKLGWQNAFATKGEVFSARYTGIAQWAPVDGIGLSRRAGTAGMTLGWDVSDRTQIGFDVDQRFADRDHARSASATFRMKW
ncbi:S8 family serine peptidase [Luteibacter sp. 329MFSha]|uniref:S8 family serine peptidase n=1 Tax=Luteibacter sp. 329MFSha TaxID=1798239 RepID=UPI0008C48DF7|nr:S8 family serine peptidase [Luteibacter sp. 329MFSha]SEV85569.1 Uncharacterized conserved protein, contains a C-terminal beta-barrel porin domain [Luteibacter sp. 329MFSha]